MSRYSQLFSIEVRHGFYSSGLCQDFEFIPTTQTARQMSNTGLLCKQTMGRIRVFYSQDGLDSLLVCAADETEPLNLVFKAYARDPHFLTYTEGLRNRDDEVPYFDSSNALEDNGGSLRLHADEYAGSEEFQQLGSPGLRGVVTKKDLLVRPTFVVNISVPEKLAIELSEDPIRPARDYFVRFQQRLTVWKYFFLGDLAREDLFIADLDNTTEFESSGSEALAGQRVAVTFKSKTPLPMHERSEYRFQLREKGSGNGKVLIRRLPVASAAQIGVELTQSQTTLVSEIYINS